MQPEHLLSKLTQVRVVEAHHKYTARCPAHHDKDPSLSVTFRGGKVLLHCHAGCPVDAVCANLQIQVADLFYDLGSAGDGRAQPAPAPGQPPGPLTVAALAAHKALPEGYLRSIWGLENGPAGVGIPVYDPRRAILCWRTRSALAAKDGTRHPPTTPLPPYGLHLQQRWLEAGWLILAEGESNAWTAAFHSYPCCGILGAAATSSVPDMVRGLGTVAIMQDPDEAGVRFVRGCVTRLTEMGFQGRATVVRLPVKDLSELHLRDPNSFRAALDGALRSATVVLDGGRVATVPASPSAGPRALTELAAGSEVELANHLLNSVAGPGDLVFTEGKFWRYLATHGYWQQVPEGALSQTLIALDGTKKTTGGVLKVSSGLIVGVLKVLAHIVAAEDFFGQGANVVGFANCVLAAEGQSIVGHPHGHAFRLRACQQFPYHPEATAPRFHQFLVELFEGDSDAPQKRMLIQEAMGASLFGLAPKFQRCFVLVGGGSNGRSTLLDVWRSLFPQWSCVAVPPHRWGEDYQRAMLAGAAFNGVSELPESELMRSENFKAIVVGDPVMARAPYSPPFQFVCRATHVFAPNSLPTTRDHSHGFWRRFLLVTFNRRFQPEKEPGLKERLLAELPGIAAWAVAGAQRLLAQRDYTLPDSHRYALAEWQRQTDQLRLFVEGCCQPVLVDQGVHTRTLYEGYCAWALQAGIKNRYTLVTFSKRLNDMGLVAARRATGSLRPLRLCHQANWQWGAE